MITGKREHPEHRFGLAHELAEARQRQLDERMRCLLIAQLPSRQRDEHIFERRAVRAELAQRGVAAGAGNRAAPAPSGAAPTSTGATCAASRRTSRTPGSADSTRRRSRDAVAERELDDVLGAERRDQLARRAERDQLALVHDADAIAELVRFVHVVRGDQDGAAVARETARAPPTAGAATADRGRSSARRETAARARPASAHATDSRCFCPPDSFDTHASRFDPSSTVSSSSSTVGPRG